MVYYQDRNSNIPFSSIESQTGFCQAHMSFFTPAFHQSLQIYTMSRALSFLFLFPHGIYSGSGFGKTTFYVQLMNGQKNIDFYTGCIKNW